MPIERDNLSTQYVLDLWALRRLEQRRGALL